MSFRKELPHRYRTGQVVAFVVQADEQIFYQHSRGPGPKQVTIPRLKLVDGKIVRIFEGPNGTIVYIDRPGVQVLDTGIVEGELDQLLYYLPTSTHNRENYEGGYNMDLLREDWVYLL
jgi:hypothetical protein